VLALPLYIFSLGVSGGLVGVLARRELALQGFAPTFEAGVQVALTVGLAFALLQVLYGAVLRLAKPTWDNLPWFNEALSNLGAVVLLPYVLGVEIPWPVAALAKVEVFIFLGLFGAVHAFFKLVALFAATQSRKAGRVGALLWVAGGFALWAGLQHSFDEWKTALDAARVTSLPPMEVAQAGELYARARQVPEGLAVPIPADQYPGMNLVLRWAQPPEVPEPPQRIHVTIEADGLDAPVVQETVDLSTGGWMELRVPESLLRDLSGCRLTWSTEDEPVWVTYTGVRPVAMSNQQVLLSGPWWRRPREADRSPSMVVLVVEGLGAEQVSSLGYARATTPNLDAFANESHHYRNAFSPAPEAAAACMTLLTGLSPLAHGYLGAQAGPLPDAVQTLPEVLQDRHYATAAFTEGDAPGDLDLVHGSGFERGFELFSHAYPTTRSGRKGGAPLPPGALPAGAGVTLEKAAAWMEDHAEDKFLLFVRLRELRAPQWMERYGTGFIASTSPAPVDIYDTALQDVDKQLGLFFERLRALPGYDNTAVILTSTNGFDFGGPWRTHFQRRLTESTVHVPLVLRLPAEPRRAPTAVCDLEDVAPTLLETAGAAFMHRPTGRSLLTALDPLPVVSMLGDPLVLSLRESGWRYGVQTGLSPFSRAEGGTWRSLGLIDLSRYTAGLWQYSDVARREASRVRRYEDYLREYLEQNRHTPPAAAPSDGAR
jgi:arylsulfatase